MGNVFADFLVNKGLYDTIEITKDNIEELCDLIEGKVRISIYCKECKENRVFSMEPLVFELPVDENHIQKRYLGEELRQLQVLQKKILPKPGDYGQKRDWYWKSFQCDDAVRIMVFSFHCSMDEHHTIDYVVQTNGNLMKKIGQYPSLADLSLSELKDYRKVVDETNLRELKRAIGLHAQGIGVGAYVYLRRIFERIIIGAGRKAVEDGRVEQKSFDRARMDEKIKLLKEDLPNILIETPEFYGIVSKGVHELSEHECIAFFPLMQEAIIMILREWDEKRKVSESEKRIKESFSKIAASIK